MRKNGVVWVLIAAAVLALTALLLVDLLPLLKKVAASAGNETVLAGYIDSYGLKGVPILMGLQALQIITAVIPSAAIQMLTGLCYGAWWGTLINIAGSVLGNAIVFAAVRQLHAILAPAVEKMNRKKGWISAEKLAQFKKPEVAALALFLIPGIPNGILPYLFAKTKITLPRYIAAIVLGSVPSTFLCTYLGERLSKGNYTLAMIVAGAAVVIVVAALLLRRRIMARIGRDSAEENDA
ncbi:MAG: VTT domain-containing protein [Oscillospiraceae bacterium]|nr:VTT domain-containing protein [Oscillospiraceae bacterium]